MVGQQTLDLPIGVRLPASQPSVPGISPHSFALVSTGKTLNHRFEYQ